MASLRVCGTAWLMEIIVRRLKSLTNDHRKSGSWAEQAASLLAFQHARLSSCLWSRGTGSDNGTTRHWTRENFKLWFFATANVKCQPTPGYQRGIWTRRIHCWARRSYLSSAASHIDGAADRDDPSRARALSWSSWWSCRAIGRYLRAQSSKLKLEITKNLTANHILWLLMKFCTKKHTDNIETVAVQMAAIKREKLWVFLFSSFEKIRLTMDGLNWVVVLHRPKRLRRWHSAEYRLCECTCSWHHSWRVGCRRCRTVRGWCRRIARGEVWVVTDMRFRR